MDELLLFCDCLTRHTIDGLLWGLENDNDPVYDKIRAACQAEGFVELVMDGPLHWGTHRRVYARFDTLDNLLLCKLSW